MGPVRVFDTKSIRLMQNGWQGKRVIPCQVLASVFVVCFYFILECLQDCSYFMDVIGILCVCVGV